MNCDEIRNLAARFLAGESPQDEAAMVETHLASCKQCSAELQAEREMDASLRQAMLEDEPDASAVVRRVVAQMERKPWWRRAFSMPALRLVAVATAMVLVFVGARQLYIHQVEKSMALAAAHDHYQDLVVLKRTDWAYSGQPSAQFVQTNFPGNRDLVRSITPAGGSLEKVRICSLNGTHYAHFVFQTSTGDLSVFLRVKAPGERAYPAEDFHDSSHGLEVAGFSSPDFVGAVVGPEGIHSSAIAEQTANAL